jgi:hypothetical protein
MSEQVDARFDPVLGLEEARRDVLRVSKSAFYGRDGIRSKLPIIELSAKRRGVRKSALDDFLTARTRAPAGRNKR